MKKPIAANAVSQPVAGADADRRGGDRYRTVWRIAKVTRDGDVGLWRVRNMSDRGMMLAADVPVAVGEKLEIALSDAVVVRGKVVWAEGGRLGVEFDREVDVADVLKQLAAEQRQVAPLNIADKIYAGAVFEQRVSFLYHLGALGILGAVVEQPDARRVDALHLLHIN